MVAARADARTGKVSSPVHRGDQEMAQAVVADRRGHFYPTGHLHGSDVGFIENWRTDGSIVWGRTEAGDA